MFFGRLTEKLAQLPQVKWSEQAPAIVLIALILVFGIQPSWMLRWSEAQTTSLITQDWQMLTRDTQQQEINLLEGDLSQNISAPQIISTNSLSQ